MSVPATKASSPAPRNTITRTSASVSAISHALARSAYIRQVRALRCAGRLNVTRNTGPSRSTSSSSDMCHISTVGGTGTGDDSGTDQLVDRGRVEAEFGEHGLGVRAQHRSRAAAYRGCRREPHRRPELAHHAHCRVRGVPEEPALVQVFVVEDLRGV